MHGRGGLLTRKEKYLVWAEPSFLPLLSCYSCLGVSVNREWLLSNCFTLGGPHLPLASNPFQNSLSHPTLQTCIPLLEPWAVGTGNGSGVPTFLSPLIWIWVVLFPRAPPPPSLMMNTRWERRSNSGRREAQRRETDRNMWDRERESETEGETETQESQRDRGTRASWRQNKPERNFQRWRKPDTRSTWFCSAVFLGQTASPFWASVSLSVR